MRSVDGSSGVHKTWNAEESAPMSSHGSGVSASISTAFPQPMAPPMTLIQQPPRQRLSLPCRLPISTAQPARLDAHRGQQRPMIAGTSGLSRSPRLSLPTAAATSRECLVATSDGSRHQIIARPVRSAASPIKRVATSRPTECQPVGVQPVRRTVSPVKPLFPVGRSWPTGCQQAVTRGRPTAAGYPRLLDRRSLSRQTFDCTDPARSETTPKSGSPNVLGGLVSGGSVSSTSTCTTHALAASVVATPLSDRSPVDALQQMEASLDEEVMARVRALTRAEEILQEQGEELRRLQGLESQQEPRRELVFPHRSSDYH
eukprot:TRINITY_DN16639_c0_g1_i1.p1 TRINITY_DN16639_c0_g1~~TRINITY_DN16639_c0_g1_i1.p1  ORF type:complete len:316 (-),score=14.80 TRINITY_DN16639_c0_g1_i1:91-1038(-)